MTSQVEGSVVGQSGNSPFLCGRPSKKSPPHKIFALPREKKTALFQQLIVYAGTPRRPATPGRSPALP